MKIYNSLTSKKENFTPILKTQVTMYVCGITPYDTTHLGHAFVYNFFDVLKRYLEYKNLKVNYTQNVTDIDDDTLLRAKRDNTDWKKLGEFWTKKFLNDLNNLNINIPNNYVKATDHIDTMIKIIDELIKNKYAYVVNETVYFNVKKFPEYGKLSKLSYPQMIDLSKERGADPSDPQKKNPLDFILWQKWKKGEPYWITPWASLSTDGNSRRGKGRPGWHIECSSMILDTLGERIDIHGGGADLIFPHHESEIAQSESITGKAPFVKYWMHVGMLYYEGEKMSKSLGNLVLVENLLKKHSSNSIRWLLLSHHYRKDWEYKDDDIKNSELKISLFNNIPKQDSSVNNQYIKEFEKIIDDDFDTPRVLELLLDLIEKVKSGDKKIIPTISKILFILGFEEN